MQLSINGRNRLQLILRWNHCLLKMWGCLQMTQVVLAQIEDNLLVVK